jgi:threonine synthase
VKTEGVWRYAQSLPALDAAQRITLGEANTPLVALPRWGATCGLRQVYAKLEFANPSGSFKDRGMAVLVSVARSGGARHLVEDSSGNAGASAAAYAARAGMTCTVYAPAAAPAAKLRQIRAYGAELIPVPGPRSAVADAARAAGAQPGSYHVSHNDNPLFIEGNKTFAYELIEALPRLAAGERPWHVIMPVGGGALFVGAWRGFTTPHPPPPSPSRGEAEHDESASPNGHRERNGEASSRAAGREQAGGTSSPSPLEGEGQGVRGLAGPPSPRMHAAQTTACAPIVAAWERGEAEPAAIERRPTVCGGIEIERPARGAEILRAIRESGGSAVATDDVEILAERDRLAQLEGIYAEPTSAAAFAGLAQLARRGIIAPDELVVVAITGSGLIDPGPSDT